MSRVVPVPPETESSSSARSSPSLRGRISISKPVSGSFTPRISSSASSLALDSRLFISYSRFPNRILSEPTQCVNRPLGRMHAQVFALSLPLPHAATPPLPHSVPDSALAHLGYCVLRLD